MAGDFPALHRLEQAINWLANPGGPAYVLMQGTVNTIGGGTGGTAMVDDNPFTPGGTSITPVGGYVGGRSVGSGHAAAPALSGSAILQVDVVKSVAGGGAGFATAAVYGSPAFPVYVVGSENIVAGGGSLGALGIGGSIGVLGGGGSYGVFGLGGSYGVFGAGGSYGVVGQGGSLGVVQIGAPWSVTGSVNAVLGTLPVPVVGSVNTTPLGVQIVDVRGSLVPTTWPISGSGGVFQFAATAASPNKIYLYGVKLISTATVDLQVQSPSGTTLDGSMRILPGAGFVDNAPLGTPVYIGALGSGNFVLNLSAAAQVSGIARGWVGP